MVGGGKKISAVSARARTRRNKARSSSFPLFPDMFTKAVIVLLISLLVWTYQTIIQPPPPNICGLPGGPPVTSPRIKLSDGRYLAYRERGVAKEKSEFKIIMVHGFDNSKDMALVASQELILELRIYFLSFDRAGYGESDPNPNRSVKSDTFDIQELADKLQLGSNFYVVGISMGGYPTWGCLKYIPNRLAGAALVVPIVNYWWPSFPCHLSREAYKRQLRRDQWKLRIAHYVPGLLYWWMSQKWFPSSSYVEIVPEVYGNRDKQILKMMSGTLTHNQEKIRQRDVFDTLRHDFIVAFGDWEFDPMELSNPFLQNEGSVHIWQGYEDKVVPFQLQRCISKKLPWIQYHEVPGGGHLIVHYTGLCEAVLRALLLGEEPLTLDQIHP
uniref:AB hydrolase-1 domain-containing protein n=1 Tax=Populus alba TaxID=43335 RepID=A0A4V6A7N5_POPAL|nr:uncharacterized protein D5086_0000202220 [Populus alba]